jgi:hypothetical protein
MSEKSEKTDEPTLKELALNGAITEALLLLDEIREEAEGWRRRNLIHDSQIEQIRAVHQEARKILSELSEDRRRLQGILQRTEGILGLLEQHYERVREDHGLGTKNDRTRPTQGDLGCRPFLPDA